MKATPLYDQLFRLGRIVGTPQAIRKLNQNDVFECLYRHAHGDWGELDQQDWDSNDLALLAEERLLSAYQSGGTNFYIITEADRNTTTILLPDEY